MTPEQRQTILRKLKYGPKLSREELAKWLVRLAREVMSEKRG